MSRKKSSAKRRHVQRRSLWLLAVAAVLLAFGLGLWWGGGTPSRPPRKTAQAPAKTAPPAPRAKIKPKPSVAAKPAAPKPRQPSLPRVALIIDDMGNGTKPLERLLALKIPLTVSVLPHAPQAKAVAAKARAAGLGVMLHLPMEPVGPHQQPPGQGMLRVGMTTPEILAVLKMDLARVPQAKGVNNHMGSLFSRSAARM
ncbi:MAG: divergent polysaccharide deacetylase family protein, partial [Desulfarculaceae bacterium]|nr:divergent polysaccharide deacetylase family protein [Desulfarculaceae bacterium]